MAHGQEETQRSSGPTHYYPFTDFKRRKETDLRWQSNRSRAAMRIQPLPLGQVRSPRAQPHTQVFGGPRSDPIPLAPNTFLLLLTAKDSSFLGGEHRGAVTCMGTLIILRPITSDPHKPARPGLVSPIGKVKQWAEQG